MQELLDLIGAFELLDAVVLDRDEARALQPTPRLRGSFRGAPDQEGSRFTVHKNIVALSQK